MIINKDGVDWDLPKVETLACKVLINYVAIMTSTLAKGKAVDINAPGVKDFIMYLMVDAIDTKITKNILLIAMVNAGMFKGNTYDHRMLRVAVVRTFDKDSRAVWQANNEVTQARRKHAA